MILVDANLLLYAEDSLSEHHRVAREWWDARLSGSDPVGLIPNNLKYRYILLVLGVGTL